MRAVLRRPEFRLLFAGTVASMIGDSILLLVLAMWVKDLTGSAGAAGAVILGVVLPALAGPALGYVVDRVRRRPFLIAVNILSAVALLPLLAVHDRNDIWIVYAVSLAYGVSFVFNDAALAALLKRMLPDGELAQANGASQTVKQGLRLAGPLLGAALYAVAGITWVVAIDVVSFVLAAGSLALLRVPEPAPLATEHNWTAEFTAGVRHIFGEPALRRTVLACGAAMLVFGFSESVVWAYLDHGLHRASTFAGVLSSAQGVGGIVGGLLAARLIRRYGEIAVIAAGGAVVALAKVIMIYPHVAVGLVCFMLFGAALPAMIVGIMTVLQRRTPDHLTGRVMAAADMVLSGPQVAAIGLGAVLVSVVDYRVLLAASFVILTGVATYLWPARRLTPPERAEPSLPGTAAPVQDLPDAA